MKTLLILLAIVCNMVFALGQSNLKLIQSKDQIYIFTNPNNNNKTIEYKAHTLIKNTSLSQVLNVFSMYEQHTDWVYNCEKSEILNQEHDTAYLYQVCNASWPFRNRDYVLELKKVQVSDTVTKISFTAVNNMMPPKKKTVRLDYFRGYWLIEQIGNQVKVSTYCKFDPMLSMPKALKKAYAIKIPFHTLQNLRGAFK